MYKKLDEYGKNHDLQIVTAVKKECERLSKEQCGQESLVEIENSCNQPKSDEMETTNSNVVASQGCQRVQWLAKSPVIYEDTDSDFVTKINQQIHQSLKNNPQTQVSHLPVNQPSQSPSSKTSEKLVELIAPDKGRKIVFDNLDCFIEPHEMTEDSQNKDEHWVTVMETENRISGNHLSAEKPTQDKLMALECGWCFPNKMEHQLQRADYMVLVSRIITEHVPCLQFLNNITVKHIKHQYSQKTSLPTATVSSA